MFRLAIPGLLLANLIASTCFAETQPPNILLLVADDLGYAEMGCQGNDQVQTPRLDAFAKTGVRFTRAYVTAPNCSPSRAGFLSGQFPTRFGYEFNPIGARNEDPDTGFPSEKYNLAEFLHDAGYTNGLIGKWHLGGAADFHPQRHGFDEFFGFLHEGHYFVPAPWNGTTTWIRRKALPNDPSGRRWVTPNLIYTDHMGHDEPDYDANNPVLRNGQPVPEPEYFTDAITREATSFIKRYNGNPWFLYVAYNAVHSPLQAKHETLKRFAHVQDIQRRIFLAMLYDLDRSVGQILDTLEQSGQSENTMVIFISDNGGPTKETTAANLPLRGGKGSMYEGGIRIPFLFRWPGKTEPGTVSKSIVSSLDVYKTVVDEIGLPNKTRFDGMNLSTILKNPQSTQDRMLYWRQGKRAGLVQGRWKLVAPKGFASASDWELYNLEKDLSETTNLANQSEYQEQLSELVDRWNALNDQMRESLF